MAVEGVDSDSTELSELDVEVVEAVVAVEPVDRVLSDRDDSLPGAPELVKELADDSIEELLDSIAPKHIVKSSMPKPPSP